ncbi:MAG: HEAT repeat domain-containing protein, partial [Planctomycetota bacterium]|nr:HEAT repeat domain-containing protein [Planctomycetota bacterium]
LAAGAITAVVLLRSGPSTKSGSEKAAPSQALSQEIEDLEAEYLTSLNDPNAEDRAYAAEALGRRVATGQLDAKLVVPRLVKLLNDKEPSVRAAAIRGLTNCGPGADEAIPAVAARLEDSSREVRIAALFMLGELGPAAKQAIPALTNLCQGTDLGSDAVEVLGKMGPDSIPALRQFLGRPAPDVRAAAARGLGRMGPAAQAALPELKALLSDSDQKVRWEATRALEAIQTGRQVYPDAPPVPTPAPVVPDASSVNFEGVWDLLGGAGQTSVLVVGSPVTITRDKGQYRITWPGPMGTTVDGPGRLEGKKLMWLSSLSGPMAFTRESQRLKLNWDYPGGLREATYELRDHKQAQQAAAMRDKCAASWNPLKRKGVTMEAARRTPEAFGLSELDLAAMAGDRQAVERLLAGKALPAPKAAGLYQEGVLDGRLYTPLHWAAVEGRAEVVEMLLAKGALADARQASASQYPVPTPLHLAAGEGHAAVVKALLGKGASTGLGFGKMSPLHDVADRPCAELLVAGGARADLRGGYGGPGLGDGLVPLQTAAGRGRTDVVAYLLEKAKHSADDLGYALLMASAGGHDKTVQLLLAKGADKDYRNVTDNVRPLLAAAGNGFPDVVEALLKAGANPNSANRYKQTALHLAVRAVTSTPSQCAVVSRTAKVDHAAVIAMLLSKGADQSLKDAGGKTAAEVAKESAKDPAIQKLFERKP